VRSVAEQLNDLLLDGPAASGPEARRKSDENEPEPRFLLPSLNPTTKTSPASSANREAIGSNSSRAELAHSPDPDAKRPAGSSEYETLKEPAAEDRVKGVSENREDRTARARDLSSDASKEKSATGEKSDADKATDASIVSDNRAKRKRSYIRPCKRFIGSVSPSQKLRGKDCAKLPRSEFRVNPRAKGENRKAVGMEANDGKSRKDSENGNYKQWDGPKPL